MSAYADCDLSQSEGKGKGKGGYSAGKPKGDSKVKPKFKGKGKGSGKVFIPSRAYNSQMLDEILQQEVQLNAGSHCRHSHAERSTSQLVAMPLLAELRDLVLAAHSGPVDPAAALIPRLQDIISEAKLMHSMIADSTVTDAKSDGIVKAGELIHATKYAHWQGIKAEGLKGETSIDFVAVNAKSKRGHIAGVMGADLLIYVDIDRATADGFRFTTHPSKPDTIVCQSTTLEVKYFSKVVDIRTGELVWDLSHGGSAKDAEFTTERLRQMKLYSNSRIRYTLHKAVEIAYANANALKASDFGVMDQLHYLGTECIDDFFGRYAPSLRNSQAAVIDIGPGIGGTSRYMWEQYGARVTGVEYQQEMINVISILNSMLRIPDEEIHIEHGDFAHMDLAYVGLEGQFSAFTSQLVFLHIADKESLFEKCGQALREGGYFMIEDYFVQDGQALTEEDRRLLAEDVSVPNGMPSTESEYRRLLASNGLVVEEWLDITDRWCTFIWDRCEIFLQARQQLEQEHGHDYVAEQAHFFAAMANLYHKLPDPGRAERYPLVCRHANWQPGSDSKGQHLRGVRIFGRKVSSPRV
eukprot:EG_transcript_5375